MNVLKWLVFAFLCLASHCDGEVFADPAEKGHPKYPISEIQPAGIVIAAPGTYVFTQDILWSPTGAGQAILIISKDVVLDLNGFTLESETTSYSTTGIVGIAAENLVIKNGTIANMGLGGINCTLSPNLVIKHITVDGLNMENTAVYTVPVGILASVSSNVTIHKCTVQNLNVKTGSLAAIQLTGVASSVISDCTVKNLLNRDGACTGIGHLLCDIAEVKDCTLDNLQSEFIDNLNTEGHTAIGIVPVTSTHLLVKDCKVSNITGCCDDAHGMSIFECEHATVRDCHVENVLDGAGPAQTGAKATGIEIYASDAVVIKCSAKNIQAINPQDKQAAGFSCAQGTGISFIKCYAENITVVDEFGNINPDRGFGVGFGWAPDPRPDFLLPATNVLYKKCKAKNCLVGFDSWFHIDSRWKRVKSICNQVPILIQPNEFRTISCNPCSECGCTEIGCYPTPLIVTFENVATGNQFVQVKVKDCD